MYVYYNPNPRGKFTTDCVIRMLTKVYQISWEEAYLRLSVIALAEYEMPSSNHIWETYLQDHGFTKSLLPHSCPRCITIRDFTKTYVNTLIVLCTGSHVVAAENGCYYDAWDSGDEVVSYIFERR